MSTEWAMMDMNWELRDHKLMIGLQGLGSLLYEPLSCGSLGFLAGRVPRRMKQGITSPLQA